MSKIGKLYFRYGTMGSAKTALLLTTAYNFEERGMAYKCFKPVVDTREQKNVIRSRIGIERECSWIYPDTNLYAVIHDMLATGNGPRWILVDEAQFLSPEQVDQLARAVDDFGINVICYGLRTDFSLNGFPGSTRLLELAHTIEEMKTICACGRKAICNGRKVNGEFVFEGAQVAIDTVDNVEYQSLCPQCWYREYRAFLARHPHK